MDVDSRISGFAQWLAWSIAVGVSLAACLQPVLATDYAPYDPSRPGTQADGAFTQTSEPPPPLDQWDVPELYPFVTRLSGGHDIGKGIGVDTGFTTLGWFMPLSGDVDDEMYFGDARFIIRDDATVGANLGLGYRKLLNAWDRIVGGNFYYDYRQTDKNDFNQLGLGLESLGRWIDLRSNFYFPVGEINQPRSRFFQGNNLIIVSDSAMTGLDYEIGVSLPPWGCYQARLFFGGYYFDGPKGKNATGWRARAEQTLDSRFAVDVSVQDDNLFGATTVIGIAYRQLERLDPPQPQARMPMDQMFWRTPGSDSVAYRLGDPVQRLQNIVMTSRQDVARADGVPINFLHVDAGNPGVGTFEDPYPDLTTALADPDAGTSIIYTPFGGNYVENVTLVPGAQILSNGPVQSVRTQFGSVRLPFSGASRNLSNLPTISGDVTMADDSRFSGFDVTGSLTGTNISNVTVDSSLFSSAAGDAIVFTTVTDLTLTNVTAASSAGRGMQLNDVAGALTNVTVTSAADDGIEINNAADDRTITLTDVNVAAAGGEGLDVNVAGAGDLTLSLLGTNTLTSVGNALDVNKSAAGNAILVVNGTTAASSTGAGMNFDGSAGAGVITITSFQNNAVTQAAVGGVLFNRVTFDSDLATTGIQQVNAGSLLIGDPDDSTQITGDGLSLINPTGNLFITQLDVSNDNGAGLVVDTKGLGTTFTLGTGTDSTINTTNGAAMDLDPLTLALNFDRVFTANSPTSGIFLDTATGTLNIQTLRIVDSTNKSIVIQNTPAALTLNLADTTIDSLFGPTLADNVDISVNNGSNVTINFTRLRIVFP